MSAVMAPIFSKLRRFRKEHKLKEAYATHRREPFYDVVKPYLPKDADGVIVDVGSGDGSFARHLHLHERYKNVRLLDGNEETVDKASGVEHYVLPQRMSFEDGTVSFLHASHVIEHLAPEELYVFLQEVSRVLAPQGIFAVSAPLLRDDFYGDLSHVKPYNPIVLIKYMGADVAGPNVHYTRPRVSDDFSVEKLVYRYQRKRLFEDVGSPFWPLDLVFFLCGRLLWVLGIRRYVRTGYTLVLRKA